MYFLVRLHIDYARRIRCVVTHLPQDGDPEVLEDRTVPDPENPSPDRDFGWLIPLNPANGDVIRFELAEVRPTGPNGAGYWWDAQLCSAHGPGGVENPEIFRAEVPLQTAADISECPEAVIMEARARKDGPCSFTWTVNE